MLPQSLNLYEYAADNPLRYIDPNGFDPAEVIKGLSHISFQLQEVWQRPLEDYVTNGKIENLTSRSAANSAQGGGEAIAGGGIVAVGIYALLAASGPVGWVGGGVGIVGGATLGGSGIHGMRKSAKELAAELPEMLKIYKFEKEVEDVVSKINPMSVREYTMDELWLALAETDTIHKTGLLPQRLDDQAAGASAIIRAEIDRRNKEKEEEDKRRKKCEASGVCLI